MSTSQPDYSHLDAIEARLIRERQRLAEAKNPKEIELRAVWVAQTEKERADELRLLGLDSEVSLDDLETLLRDIGE